MNFERERQAKKEKKQRKVYEGLPTITQGKGETRVKRRKERRQKKKKKNAANNNIDEEPLVIDMKFAALSRSLKQAKSSFAKDRAQKRAAVKALFEATIPVTPRKSKLLPAR